MAVHCTVPPAARGLHPSGVSGQSLGHRGASQHGVCRHAGPSGGLRPQALGPPPGPVGGLRVACLSGAGLGSERWVWLCSRPGPPL